MSSDNHRTIELVLLQYSIATNDSAENLRKIESLLSSAFTSLPSGPRVVVLPELFHTGFGEMEKIRDQAVEFESKKASESPLLGNLRKLAGTGACSIIGTLVEKSEEGLYNTAFRATKERIQPLYRKIHLFEPLQEKKYILPGPLSLNVFSLVGINAGVQICYDLRFPEASRFLANAGVDIIFFPANWPKQRISHWDLLLRSRAVENQCYVVGVNRVGSDASGEYCGHSQIVEPGGTVLTPISEVEQAIHFTIEDFDKGLYEARKRFQVKNDSRMLIKT